MKKNEGLERSGKKEHANGHKIYVHIFFGSSLFKLYIFLLSRKSNCLMISIRSYGSSLMLLQGNELTSGTIKK